MGNYYVFNSPSPQEHNAGVIPGYIEETEMNLLCDDVEIIQDFNGIKHARNTKDMKAEDIVKASNAYFRSVGATRANSLHDVYHTNAGPADAHGCDIFYCPGSVEGKRAAEIGMKYMAPVTPLGDRKVSAKELYELTKTTAPARYWEIIFHTNKVEAVDIRNRRFVYAAAIVHSQCEYFGIPFKMPEANEKDAKIRELEDNNKLLQDQLNAVTTERNELKVKIPD